MKFSPLLGSIPLTQLINHRLSPLTVFITPCECISIKHLFCLLSLTNGRVSCFRRSICKLTIENFSSRMQRDCFFEIRTSLIKFVFAQTFIEQCEIFHISFVHRCIDEMLLFPREHPCQQPRGENGFHPQ